MANTTPVTDTAEAAERIAELGARTGLVDVQPIGAVTKGLAGEELAELGLMARSRARVRVFSDDGHCVHDARVMRRALEYVKAFDGVISQHAQEPAAGRRRRLLPRGRALRPARPAGLARRRRGGDRRARRHAGAPHRLPGAHRARLHRGLGRGDPLGHAARASR